MGITALLLLPAKPDYLNSYPLKFIDGCGTYHSAASLAALSRWLHPLGQSKVPLFGLSDPYPPVSMKASARITTRLPIWLNKGLARYEAGQMTTDWRTRIANG
jgi:hypothetical protein